MSVIVIIFFHNKSWDPVNRILWNKYSSVFSVRWNKTQENNAFIIFIWDNIQKWSTRSAKSTRRLCVHGPTHKSMIVWISDSHTQMIPVIESVCRLLISRREVAKSLAANPGGLNTL